MATSVTRANCQLTGWCWRKLSTACRYSVRPLAAAKGFAGRGGEGVHLARQSWGDPARWPGRPSPGGRRTGSRRPRRPAARRTCGSARSPPAPSARSSAASPRTCAQHPPMLTVPFGGSVLRLVHHGRLSRGDCCCIAASSLPAPTTYISPHACTCMAGSCSLTTRVALVCVC